MAGSERLDRWERHCPRHGWHTSWQRYQGFYDCLHCLDDGICSGPRLGPRRWGWDELGEEKAPSRGVTEIVWPDSRFL